MNRHQRRMQAAQARRKKFGAVCAVCKGEGCGIFALERRGKQDLGICLDCPCAQGVCDRCGETGKHWLGCSVVGLPEAVGEQLQ